MIKDYKNRIGDPSPGHRRFRPLALSALPLALVASGLYAALQIMGPAPENKEQVTSTEKPLQSYSLALPNASHEEPPPPAAQATLEPSVLEPAASPQLAQPIPKNDTPATKPIAAEGPLVSEQATLKIAMVEKTPIQEPVEPQPNLQWQEHKVRSGDSLARIFPKLGLSANLLHRIVNSSKTAAGLAKIRPGQKLRVALNDNGTLNELILQHSAIKSLKIAPEGDSFSAQILERELEPRTTHVSGVVQNSLYLSAQKAGLADKLIMELANIFGWDVDFALEIRAGDHFSVIYQEDYLDGKKFRDGPILAAEFTNKGRIFRAVRYVDDSGWADYFTPEGKSVRKAFLRSPVDFRRISSRFQKARWHPVLGKKRPHRGVDYAASTGTPIKAAGDGRIQLRARKGGYGKTVVIEHGGGITTLYGHLSRYKAKQRKGTRVRQGDIIGYVGSTGLASGPHLHYEFRVNGVHRNPLTVKLPAANPIAKKYRDDFLQQATPLMVRLDILNKTMLADAN